MNRKKTHTHIRMLFVTVIRCENSKDIFLFIYCLPAAVCMCTFGFGARTHFKQNERGKTGKRKKDVEIFTSNHSSCHAFFCFTRYWSCTVCPTHAQNVTSKSHKCIIFAIDENEIQH